jgi:hypothetical protein
MFKRMLEIRTWMYACCIVLGVSAALSSAGISQEGEDEDRAVEIASLFPDPGSEELYRVADSVRVYSDQELFDFINGGAPIFLEYGFRRAAIQRYALSTGSSVSAEIYEMGSSAAAYGIFSFQSVGVERGSGPGDGGVVGSYYVSFWKERYLVTVTGEDETAETREILMDLARSIEQKIAGRGTVPELARLLDSGNLGCLEHVYIRGNMGLYGNFVFDTEDIFGVQEGVVLRCPDSKLVVLRYDSERTAAEWFRNGRDQIRKSSQFSVLSGGGGVLVLEGPGNTSIRIQQFQNNLLIVRGSDSEHMTSLLERAETLLVKER